MENLPLYISVVFILTTVFTLFFLFKATRQSKIVLMASIIWLGIQAMIGLSGFYTVTDTVPPRFALLILPPLVLIAILFTTARGKAFVATISTKWLTLLHVVRVPVEIVLLWLSLQKLVPELMTFEGRNFDILSGITAPVIYYFGYVRKAINYKLLLAWNVVCIGLLFNIVVNAILAAPFPFQQFAFEQPNLALVHFPFVWLPCFIVPVVLFAHLVCIRQLLLHKTATVRRPSLQSNFA